MIEIGDVINIEKGKSFALNQNGQVKANSAYNVMLALMKDPALKNSLRLNEFSQEVVLTQDINLNNIRLEKGPLPASFQSVLMVYLEEEIEVSFSTVVIRAGLEAFLKQHSFNPVKEYMEKAAKDWDGRERIGKMFQVYLGAEDIPIISKIAEMWMLGAVAKVYDPYVKFDYVLDLVGGQGVGKTSFLQKIGGEWYTDSVTDFTNKDNFDIMLKSLIVNDDEMVASDRMTFAETKAFVSKTSLRFRRPYASVTEEFPKNFVLCRTTNYKEYLKDMTGERRFLAVEARAEHQQKHPMEIKQSVIDQIWGEAVNLYKKGADLAFDAETESELNDYREQFLYRDEMELQISQYLEMPVPSNWSNWTIQEQHQYTQKYFDNSRDLELGNSKLTKVSTREIMYNLYMQSVSNRKMARKINLYMEHLPDWTKKQIKINGKNLKGFVKKMD